MPEDAWMRTEREFFVNENYDSFSVPRKDLNKIIEKYNCFLRKALIGESPFVAEDLRLTILSGGKVDRDKED